MHTLVPAILALFVSCAPGSATVNETDMASSDATSTSPDQRTTPASDAGPTGDVSTVSTLDTAVVPDEGNDDLGIIQPDLPPSPSRVWTAELDGTVSWWEFDHATSTLSPGGSIERGGRITFLALSEDRTRLYATNQDRVEGFDITQSPPVFLGDANAGANGTHLTVDATGQYVFVASYGGHQVSMLPLGDDGTPQDVTIQLGGAADPDFCQNAHQVRVHPSNEFVYVPCLGSDHVAVLAFDAANGTLDAEGGAATMGGAGPRHMDFHPTLPQAYVIGELDDTITRFEIDPDSGALTMLDSTSTRPDPDDELGPASDVHVTNDGSWILGVNRNPRDELVSFALGTDGALSSPRHVSTGGMHARTFAIAPDDRHVLVGNSNSMELTVFTLRDGVAELVDTIDGFDDRLFFVGFE